MTSHPNVEVLNSLMIEDSLKELVEVNRSGVIIGGNFVSWYGGFDSFIIGKEIKLKKWMHIKEKLIL